MHSRVGCTAFLMAPSRFALTAAIKKEKETRNKSITSKAMQYRQDVGSLYQE